MYQPPLFQLFHTPFEFSFLLSAVTQTFIPLLFSIKLIKLVAILTADCRVFEVRTCDLTCECALQLSEVVYCAGCLLTFAGDSKLHKVEWNRCGIFVFVVCLNKFRRAAPR